MNKSQYRPGLSIAAASLLLYSCSSAGDDLEYAQRMCSVIDSMGAAIECAVTESEHAIDVTADTTAVDASNLCTSFSGMLEALTHTLTNKWQMRVFSDQDSESPEAVCDLG